MWLKQKPLLPNVDTGTGFQSGVYLKFSRQKVYGMI